MKKVQRLLKKAERLRQEKDAICDAIASELQPYFRHEITVDYQNGDGFVVIWQDSVFLPPNNKNISDAIDDIKSDPNCFL